MHFESFFGTLALAVSLLTRSLSPTGALGSDVVTLMLLPPNLVVELLNFTDQGRIGTFSMMYDQGIEIRSSSHFTLSHFLPTFKHTHTQAHIPSPSSTPFFSSVAFVSLFRRISTWDTGLEEGDTRPISSADTSRGIRCPDVLGL